MSRYPIKQSNHESLTEYHFYKILGHLSSRLNKCQLHCWTSSSTNIPIHIIPSAITYLNHNHTMHLLNTSYISQPKLSSCLIFQFHILNLVFSGNSTPIKVYTCWPPTSDFPWWIIIYATLFHEGTLAPAICKICSSVSLFIYHTDCHR